MTQAEVAIARDAIRDLVARYNQLGDAGRTEELAMLFAEEAVMETPNDLCHGREGITKLFASVAERTKQVGGIRKLRHFTTTHSIDIENANSAVGICYYQVLTDRGLDHWGVYYDRYALIDQYWLFAMRTATVDGMTPDGWAAKVMDTHSD